MKKSRIIGIFNFLNGIKLNKITSKEIRSAIVSNHLQMYKIAQDHNEAIKEVQKRLFEGKDEQINLLNSLREEYKNATDESLKKELIARITNECSEILSLEKEFNDIFTEIINEEINLTLKKVDQSDFIQACVEADVDITSGDLIILTDLFE